MSPVRAELRQCRRDGCDGLLPGGVNALMADLCQASLVYPTKTVAPLIAHPPLVDVRVVTGLQAQDPCAVVEMRSVEYVMDVHIAPLHAAVAHRWGAREIPDSRFETEIHFGEGSHRADVHDIGRVGIVQPLTGIESQLSPVPSVKNAELRGLGDLVRKTHAAGTQDAALLVQHHVRANGHGLLLLDLLLPKPGVVKPEVHVKVLKVAFSRLVTDGAVERVVGQEEFQHRPPAILSVGALRVHHHSFGHWRIAGDLELGVLLHLHQADTAVSGDGKPRVVAVARDVDAELLRGLDDRAALRTPNLPAINRQGRHTAASHLETINASLLAGPMEC